MPKRTDANQKAIVKELRQLGFSVQSLADVGDGCPDIVVGRMGRNFLFEIKDPSQPPSKRKLTPAEKKWHEGWRGQVHKAESLNEILRIFNG